MATLVAYLALVPVGTMVVASFQTGFLQDSSVWTWTNYIDALSQASFYRLLGTSVAYALGTAVVSLMVGFGLAILVVRTNAPFKAFASLTAVVPLILPGILNTVAWLLLLTPHVGLVAVALSAIPLLPPITVYSMWGMIFIQSIHVTPIAFIMGLATFSSMDASLEEASLTSGATTVATFWRITLPLARPAIFGAGFLIFVQTIASFEVPVLVGEPARIHVFVSQIYDSLAFFPPQYGRAGATAAILLVIAVLGVVIASRISGRGRHATVTGKGFRPSVIDLGRWRWLAAAVFLAYFLVAVALPLSTLAWSSLLPEYSLPSLAALRHLTLANYRTLGAYPLIKQSIVNTTIAAIATGLITTLLASVISYITVRSRLRGRWVLDVLATAPIAVPSVVLGVGILFWYLVAPLPVHLYGSLAILVVAFVTISLPYAVRYTSAGMLQIRDELEEAASVSGATWLQTFRRVFLPLMAASLTVSVIYSAILSYREISAAIFLYAQGTSLVSTAVFDLWSNGQYSVISALGVVLVAILVVLVAAVQLIGGRFRLEQPAR